MPSGVDKGNWCVKPDIKLTVVFGLGLLLIVVVGISSLLGMQRVADSNRMVAHTQEVLASLEHISSLLKDAETGQRGFVLTGEERYLEPYNAAVDEVGKVTDSLAALTRDNPDQQQSIRQLVRLSQEKFAELRETIRLRREGGQARALIVIRSDRGKQIMDGIRSVVGQMEAREWQLLGKRSRVAGDTALQNSWKVMIGMLLSLAGLAAVAVIMIRTLRVAQGSAGPAAGKSGKMWRGTALRYLCALVLVSLAMLARQSLESSFGPMPPFITFYPAVLLAASIAGGGPGILTTMISVLAADYWYFQPLGQFGINSPNDAISLGIFASASMFLSVLAERLHRARLAEAVSITQQQELALLEMGNLLVLDQERRIQRWSQGCCRLYGFEAREALGRPVDELLQTRRSESWEVIQRSLLDHGYWEGEISRRSKSGAELALTVLLAQRRDLRGRPQVVLEVSTDLTAQKSIEAELLAHKFRLLDANSQLHQGNEQLQAQAEELQMQGEELQAQAEELQAQNQELADLWNESRRTKEALAKSQDRLTLALSSARLGTFEWDIINDKRYFDDLVHGLLRTDPLNFTGSAEEFYRVIHPDDREAVRGALSAALASDGAYLSEYRVIWPDGTIHFIAARGKMHRDGAGQPARLMGVCWDVTERKHAEAELQQSEERFSTLADAIPQLCWAADAEGAIFWYNRRWYEYTGTAAEDMEGWGWQSVHDPEVLPKVLERWRASIATGKPFEMVFPLRGGDGVFRPFLTRVMPLCDPDGTVVRWFGTNTDIAEREQTTTALRQSEERYRSLFDSMLEGFCIIEVLFDGDERPIDYRFLEINPAFEGQTGLRNAQGKLMRELAPEHEAHWFEIYGKVALTGEATHFVNEAKMLDRWYDVNAYRVGGEESRKVAILFNDISESKRAEVALRESKERLSLFIEHAPAALAMFDREMRYLSVSRRWRDDYHLGERDLVGISHYDMFPEVSDEWQEYHRRGLSGEVLRSEADRFERIDGSAQWLRWEIRPWLDAAGAVGGIVIFAEDTSKQHLAEEALGKLNEELEERIARRTGELEESRNQLEEQAEELTQSLNSLEEEVTERQMSEERLRLLIDGAKDYAIVMLEVDGSVSSWNDGATRLKGWGEQEALGRHFSLFYPEESVAAGVPQRELELAASGGRIAEEGWRMRKDGSRFLAEVIITAIRDDSGKLRGYSKITRDITERKLAEEQIQLTLAELERSNKELEQFAYVASHDLQEPLRMVSSFTQLLAQRYEGQLDDQARKFIDYAVDGAVRMQRLINDLLAYSRVSTQGKTLETIDSHAALGEALRNLAGSIEENRAIVASDDLPTVRADATQLSQLFQNLIGNAIKFRGAEAPLIRISASDLGREWRFSVRDNGIGIEDQYAEKVFVIFQRLHTRQEYPGTGIGLAICKRVVERHGGRIWFESEAGKGSTFNFTIPK